MNRKKLSMFLRSSTFYFIYKLMFRWVLWPFFSSASIIDGGWWWWL